MEATMVSIYSLNTAFALKPTSKTDIIVLLPESIQFQQEDIQQLERLGAHVIRTTFPTTGLKLNTNACDHTMLNLWALLDYQKIVYFSPDIVFENDVDQFINIPVGSAIITGNFNIPLFVLEPTPETFELLVHEYRRKPHTTTFTDLLETLIDYRLRLPVRKNALVFTGPMKPWNFHTYRDVDWSKYYDPISFYKWRTISNDVRHLFNPHSEWKNEARQRTVCDSYLSSVADIRYFAVKDQFSVMLSTYNPERIRHLSLLIRHLLKSTKIHTVFITWHNPDLQVPDTLYLEIEEADYHRVKVLSQTFDSLNNRFNPTEELQTEAVYIMDDDIYIDLEDLEFTFSAWQSRKDSVVGHFPRSHTYNPETHEATYRVIGQAPYSIILTKSMFIRSDYLFSYTCLLEPDLHASVDRQLNCEDLGFAMMASGLSGAGPTYVRTQKSMEDFGLKKGISTNAAHMPARSQCIADFITKYWHTHDPLIPSTDAAAPFVRPLIRTGSWQRVTKSILN
ncbi:hypothetical protein HPULCUR_006444 [Helicostylum pulchrum]|uniref:Glycosyl transferase 64 domain-containing protein n=1 Tax=Helicostylum pulchrum TaxID=562976 RepID=A0ABP9Y1X7_9FUNG